MKFTAKDIAYNGQCAPLVCFADEKWFKGKNKNFAIQNIGGIANVTVVSKDFETFGFDTGLGNIMIDYCTQKYFSLPYDKDGEMHYDLISAFIKSIRGSNPDAAIYYLAKMIHLKILLFI